MLMYGKIFNFFCMKIACAFPQLGQWIDIYMKDRITVDSSILLMLAVEEDDIL